MKVLNTSRRQKNTRGNWKIKSAYTTNKLTVSPTGRAHSRRVKYTKSNIKICMNISHRTCDQNIKCIWPPKLAVYRGGSILKYYTIKKNIQLLRTQHWFQVFNSKKYKIGGSQSRMSLPANKITCFEGICLNEIHRFAIVYELSFKNST